MESNEGIEKDYITKDENEMMEKWNVEMKKKMSKREFL